MKARIDDGQYGKDILEDLVFERGCMLVEKLVSRLWLRELVYYVVENPHEPDGRLLGLFFVAKCIVLFTNLIDVSFD